MSTLAIVLSLATAQTGIESVVVYPDRAQVTRQTFVSCTDGAQTITFSGIPPAAAADSFRARGDGVVVQGLRSESKVRTEQFAPALTATGYTLNTWLRPFAS